MKKALYFSLPLLIFLISCKNKNTLSDALISEKPITSKYNCVPPITDAEWYKIENVAPLLDGYDAVKYRYKTRVNPQSFFKRRDKYFFAKLGKTYGKDLVKYYVSNFIKDVGYVGDMLGPDGEANYNDMMKVHESLSYRFKNDINIYILLVFPDFIKKIFI